MSSRKTRRSRLGQAETSLLLSGIANEVEREDVPPDMLALAHRLQAALDQQHKPVQGPAKRGTAGKTTR